MTKNTLTIELSCNGKTLKMGPGEDIDLITISGLESSELEVSMSDNALVDGASVDGKKIKPRHIHIEAKFRSDKNNPENRAKMIRFFNPKYSGQALITSMGVSRNIEYELEGWTFAAQKNMDERLKILVDLICPDPYMRSTDDFGQNMAAYTAQLHFPWHSLQKKDADVKERPKKAQGLLLGGMITGYRTLHKDAVLVNDGDVPAGLQIRFYATRGTVRNPKITNTGTGQFMRVVCDMQQGDVLLINTDKRHQVITLNGENCYQHIDRRSEPFELAVGENHLEYDADENYTNLDVFLYYRPKYLGV